MKEPPTGAKPRALFDNACEHIAEPLKKLGFKYRKKNKDIYKTDVNFIYRIWFQTSKKHGGSSRFIVHLAVESEKIASLRKNSHDSPCTGGTIITTTLINLTKKDQTLGWYDLAPASERERVISEIVGQVHDFAIPFFLRFENFDFNIEELNNKGFLPHRYKKSVSYLEQHVADFIGCYGNSLKNR